MRLVEIGLKELNALVGKAADLSMEAFDTALQAIKDKNREEKRLKVKELVKELRKLREEIDELSLEIIARYQPVASELRRVKAAIELGYAFLRFGRYSYDALAAFSRAEKLGIECDSKKFDEMAPIVKGMMQDAIKSIKELDVILALKVISKDDEVDQLYHKYLTEIMTSYDSVACAVVEALAIKFLERAADHSVHVAAQTVFVVEGKMPE
ncbi:hypothetical protein IPA_08470 [Ignicoccus pacificus DSM 13166]|uniref:PhoU domain-containing protein n=1 Tax=Ignicoccus pacificus DSM 13166 TaxID=940294 RepID=A0A977PLZ4_9CREN|nr:hypothetical protein IPA_08470 [Ignicoccus pacificus DSM 13166]